MELVIPPELPQATIELVQQRAVEAFVAGECEGMARVDFFVRDDGEVILNELNTIPGFTATSVYAKLFDASGVPYAELLDRLIALALERHERRSRLGVDQPDPLGRRLQDEIRDHAPQPLRGGRSFLRRIGRTRRLLGHVVVNHAAAIMAYRVDLD